MKAVIDGVGIINATPHEIRFLDKAGNVVSIGKSGYTLPAVPVEEIVQTVNGVTFVRTVFKPSPQGEEELRELEREYPDALIIGSIISAQAFPGKVKALVPVPGKERVPPTEKVFLADKFTLFD